MITLSGLRKATKCVNPRILGTLVPPKQTTSESRSKGIMHAIRENRTEAAVEWMASLDLVQPAFTQSSKNSTVAQVEVVNEILRSSLLEISMALENKVISSVELITLCFAQIEKNASNNIYLSLFKDAALESAKASDQRIQQGSRLSILDGVPVSLKDNFALEGSLTTAGSHMLENFTSPYDSTIASRLKANGAIIIGKTNMDEFGMGSYTLNSAFGKTTNPLTEEARTCGGSSGGASAALAANTCFLSIGSDTGGSVRLPATYTGTVGLKPTYGYLSRWGLIAYASSLDVPGIMAKSSEDILQVLPLLAGRDGLDSTCIFDSPAGTSHETSCDTSVQYDKDVQDFNTFFKANIDSYKLTKTPLPLTGLKVGIPEQLIFKELSPQVLQMWDATAMKLRDLGAEISIVSVPSLDRSVAAYYVIAPSEAVSNLSRYDGVRYGPSHYTPENTTHRAKQSQAETSTVETEATTGPKRTALQLLYESNRSSFFGQEVQKRIMLGNFAMSSEKQKMFAEKAMQIRGKLIEELQTTMTYSIGQEGAHGVHFMLFPTSKSCAPTFHDIETLKTTDPMGAYIDDVMTVFPNLVGLPAVAFPAGSLVTSDLTSSDVQLPIGMQIMGSALTETSLLEVSSLLESELKSNVY